MPAAKPAKKGEGDAATKPAESSEPLPPRDLGPNIDANLPAVTDAWKLLDPELTTFMSLSDARVFFGALRIYPSDSEWQEKFVPDLGVAGASIHLGPSCLTDRSNFCKKLWGVESRD